MLGETLGTERDGVARTGEKCHKEEVHKLAKWQYGNRIKENEIRGARSTHGNGEKLVQKCSYIMKANRSVVRPELRWGDNMEIYSKGIMCNDMGWIRLVEVRDQ